MSLPFPFFFGLFIFVLFLSHLWWNSNCVSRYCGPPHHQVWKCSNPENASKESDWEKFLCWNWKIPLIVLSRKIVHVVETALVQYKVLKFINMVQFHLYMANVINLYLTLINLFNQVKFWYLVSYSLIYQSLKVKNYLIILQSKSF